MGRAGKRVGEGGYGGVGGRGICVYIYSDGGVLFWEVRGLFDDVGLNVLGCRGDRSVDRTLKSSSQELSLGRVLKYFRGHVKLTVLECLRPAELIGAGGF